MAKTKLELAYAAYADLTISKEILKPAVAAKKSLEDYTDKEQRKTRRAWQHASSWIDKYISALLPK